jgi:hypothetical protein
MCGATNIKKAECGIGQEESASSMQWTLLYKMILECINPKNRKLHDVESLREYRNKTARDAAPYAYADDLATCFASPLVEYMQQLQAKWLSEFCAFSGLTIHPDKIKANIVDKIDPKHKLKTKSDGMKYCSLTLTVYHHQ